MALNFSTVTPPQPATLKLHILLERNDEGKAIASVLELPNCYVEAPTQEQAIEDLQKMVLARLDKIEVIPLEIQLPQAEQTENPWMKFAGVFKDDPDFAEIAESLRAERNTMDDDLESDRALFGAKGQCLTRKVQHSCFQQETSILEKEDSSSQREQSSLKTQRSCFR